MPERWFSGNSASRLCAGIAEAAVVTIPLTDFGDCLAFATARVATRPLLCIGDDFVKTDLETLP